MGDVERKEKKMTRRLRKTLGVVMYYREKNHRSPTIAEVAKETSMSAEDVREDVATLVEQGWLVRETYRPSSLVPVDDAMQEALRTLKFIAERITDYPRFQEGLWRVVHLLEIEAGDTKARKQIA